MLGFLPCLDLNDDVMVSKKWRDIIKGSGTKLPQRQELDMVVKEAPFSVVLSNGKKLIERAEGQKAQEIPVLKNGIVKAASFQGTFQEFEERYRRVAQLVGVQPVPIKVFTLRISDPIDELARFRGGYSGILFYTLDHHSVF